MKIFNLNSKIIGLILIVIIYLSTSPAKSLDKFAEADRVSDYFSGILLLNENKYEESFNFLKKLNGLETNHLDYSKKYLFSLINSENFKEAFIYSKKLEKQKLDNFESHLIMGIFYLKNNQMDLAQKYFSKSQKSKLKIYIK